MASKLKAAVIGCGGMGGNHVLGYLATGRFEVVAISDMNPDAMDEMDARVKNDENYHPDRFTDPNRMLDSQTFDVISIMRLAPRTRGLVNCCRNVKAANHSVGKTDGGKHGSRRRDANSLRPKRRQARRRPPEALPAFVRTRP